MRAAIVLVRAVVGVATAFAGVATMAADSPPVAQAARGGTLWLRPNPDLFQHLGVRVFDLPGNDQWSMTLWPRTPVEVELGDGAPTRLRAGELMVPALRFERADGQRSPVLRLIPDGVGPLNWRAVDARGDTWLRIAHGMRSPDRLRDGLRLVTADLRVGPALADWAGREAEGRLLANAALHLPLQPLSSGDEKAATKSCDVPNWPGVNGFVADVELIDMDDKYTASVGVDVLRCRGNGGASACDGPGGVQDEVVIVPSAVLRNRDAPDAADLPWHTKFSGEFEPYGNDQHPFLTWTMYRFDADGRIDQIARSGVKHAFATANEFCHAESQCPPNGQILGRACEDTYNAGSNDQSFFMSPRSEFIPALGIWGRCGSVFDDTDNNPGDGLIGCDGVQDAPPNDFYRERLVARESDIHAAVNPGAQYHIDAWYLVRDDISIFNTMGSRSLAPTYSGGLWNQGPLGPFQRGPVIDRWLEQAIAGELKARIDVTTSEGHLSVATRVRRLPDNRYRYDYAIMNFDFARAVTDLATSEPNLRVLSNRGVAAFDLDLAHDALVDSSEFRDGDSNAGNNWSLTTTGNAMRWSAPSGATHDWGHLRFVRVISAFAPGPGELRLEVADPGTPTTYTAALWVPDGDVVFRDGYE